MIFENSLLILWGDLKRPSEKQDILNYFNQRHQLKMTEHLAGKLNGWSPFRGAFYKLALSCLTGGALTKQEKDPWQDQ